MINIQKTESYPTFEPSQRISRAQTELKGESIAQKIISLNQKQIDNWDITTAKCMTAGAILALKTTHAVLLEAPQLVAKKKVSWLGGNYEEMRSSSLSQSTLAPLLLFKRAEENEKFIESIFKTTIDELSQCSSYLEALPNTTDESTISKMRTKISHHFDNVVNSIDTQIELNIKQDNQD